MNRGWDAPQVEFDVTPGGTIWVSDDWPYDDIDWLRSFDGQSWTLEAPDPDRLSTGTAFTVAPDGAAWAVSTEAQGLVVARRGVDGWQRLEGLPTLRAAMPRALVVRGAGDIWYEDSLGRHHYTDGAWQQVPCCPLGASDVMWDFEHIADDGTVWEAGFGGPDETMAGPMTASCGGTTGPSGGPGDPTTACHRCSGSGPFSRPPTADCGWPRPTSGVRPSMVGSLGSTAPRGSSSCPAGGQQRRHRRRWVGLAACPRHRSGRCGRSGRAV